MAKAAPPQRIVSINLCTDQLAALLLPRERIASLSYLARDPHLSHITAFAATMPSNRGGGEEVAAAKPDLVLADRYAGRDTVNLLRRLGIPIFEHDPPDDVAGIEREVLRLADALGEAGRGAALIGDMHARLAAVPRAAHPVTAAWLFPNGYTSGAGTLSDAAMRAAGLVNVAPRPGYGSFALEELAQRRPDYLLLQRDDVTAFSNAGAVMDHPVVRAFWPRTRQRSVPGNLLICGTPFFAEAVEQLATLSQ